MKRVLRKINFSIREERLTNLFEMLAKSQHRVSKATNHPKITCLQFQQSEIDRQSFQ